MMGLPELKRPASGAAGRATPTKLMFSVKWGSLDHIKEVDGEYGDELINLIKSGSAKTDFLAYAWLAVETGQNIIVAGAPLSGNADMLISMSAFVPPYQRVLAIDEEPNKLELDKLLTNALALGDVSENAPEFKRRQVACAIKIRPDRLILGKLHGNETKEAFLAATLGIPLMAAFDCNSDAIDLIQKLVSEPICVDQGAISMLDVSIFVSKGIDGKALYGASEYRWLERAEVSTDELAGFNGHFKAVAIAESGTTSRTTLKESKVIAKYARANHTSISGALKELDRRSAFLEGIDDGQNSAKKVSEYICGYYEID